MRRTARFVETKIYGACAPTFLIEAAAEEEASGTNTLLALLFTMLWASAAVATKFGLAAAQPLTLAEVRFATAGLLLLGGLLLWRIPPWPPRGLWRDVAVLGLLNTTVYLGTSYMALAVVSAGVFNLFVAVNPFMVALLARGLLNEPVGRAKWLGMLVAAGGLAVGSWSAVRDGGTPIWGIGLVVVGMVAMAVGSVYFQMRKPPVSGIVINTWQLLFGALFLLPFGVWENAGHPIHADWAWWGSVAWLVFGVSIGAMLLWFHLLRTGAVRASVWLFLTPIIGYGLAAVFLHEPFTVGDGLASLLVAIGIWMAERPDLLVRGASAAP